MSSVGYSPSCSTMRTLRRYCFISGSPVSRDAGVSAGLSPSIRTACAGIDTNSGRLATTMPRPTLFEFAGGEAALLALATAHHARCLADPELNHPFSHPGHPRHVERLAWYWGEALGGPPRYSESCGGQSWMQ